MRILHEIGWRLRTLIGRGRHRAELEEELRFHVEMETEKLIARGLSRQEAQRQAKVRFGGVDRVREDARSQQGWRGLEDLVSDIRFASRSLRRSPGASLLVVLTLAIGIGATTAQFSILRGVLLQPLPYRAPDRLVEIRELVRQGRAWAPSYPNFVDWRARSQSFDGVLSIMPLGTQTVLGLGEPVRAEVLGVSQGFTSVLGVPPSLGRGFTDDENRPGGDPVVMVSDAFWRDRLGSERDLNGLALEVSGLSMRVVGVMPPGFRFLRDADVLFPHEQWPGTFRSAHAYTVVGRLAAGVSSAVR